MLSVDGHNDVMADNPEFYTVGTDTYLLACFFLECEAELDPHPAQQKPQSAGQSSVFADTYTTESSSRLARIIRSLDIIFRVLVKTPVEKDSTNKVFFRLK